MGAVCCPYFVDLPNGWTFTAISWSLRTVSEEPVEWYGIAPDLYVDAPEELLDQGVDPVLEYAMDMLEDY
jgi:C-terminal processing protease CtpA/Prc